MEKNKELIDQKKMSENSADKSAVGCKSAEQALKESGKSKKPKKKSKIGMIIGFSILGVVLAAIAIVAIWVVPAVTNPASMFDFDTDLESNESSEPEVVTLQIIGDDEATSSDTLTQEQATEATPEPVEEEQVQFDHIINIALLGLDPKDKEYATDGGDSHTDGIVVVSVNFDTNTVNMISFPRDTYTKVPGFQGFYKINCAMDVGGEDTDAGFMTTCATLSQFLGGVPVNYYVAIEHDIVITLGDEIGGVDFDLPFSYTGKLGISYQKGYQHLDGKGIYDYMRCRKECPYPYNTDVSRTQRCREMLLAIFDKLKSGNMLTKIPDIISTVSSGIYTNLTSRQMVALGTYAMNFSMSDVGSYNFDGSLEMNHGWVFYFIDQESRKEILKTVYGIDAEPIGWCSNTYANWMYDTGHTAYKYLSQAKKVLTYADTVEGGMNDKTKKLYDDVVTARSELKTAFDAASAIVERNYFDNYSADDKAAKEKAEKQLSQKEHDLRDAVKNLYNALGSPSSISLSWEVKQWYTDPDVCDVIVDMR